MDTNDVDGALSQAQVFQNLKKLRSRPGTCSSCWRRATKGRRSRWTASQRRRRHWLARPRSARPARARASAPRPPRGPPPAGCLSARRGSQVDRRRRPRIHCRAGPGQGLHRRLYAGTLDGRPKHSVTMTVAFRCAAEWGWKKALAYFCHGAWYRVRASEQNSIIAPSGTGRRRMRPRDVIQSPCASYSRP